MEPVDREAIRALIETSDTTVINIGAWWNMREKVAALVAEVERLRAKAYGIRVGTTPLINTHDDLLDAVQHAPNSETIVLANVPVRLIRPLLALADAARAFIADDPDPDWPSIGADNLAELIAALAALDAGGEGW